MRTRILNTQITLLVARLGLIVTLFLSVGVFAEEIYKWTDQKGVVHFGDSPPVTAVYSVPEIKINSYLAPQSGEGSATLNGDVVMYGTSWCGYCKKAKRYFVKEGIPFKEYDIEKSSIARRKYDQLNGRGVPLIIVGNQRLSGFSEKAFERIRN